MPSKRLGDLPHLLTGSIRAENLVSEDVPQQEDDLPRTGRKRADTTGLRVNAKNKVTSSHETMGLVSAVVAGFEVTALVEVEACSEMGKCGYDEGIFIFFATVVIALSMFVVLVTAVEYSYIMRELHYGHLATWALVKRLRPYRKACEIVFGLNLLSFLLATIFMLHVRFVAQYNSVGAILGMTVMSVAVVVISVTVWLMQNQKYQHVKKSVHRRTRGDDEGLSMMSYRDIEAGPLPGAYDSPILSRGRDSESERMGLQTESSVEIMSRRSGFGTANAPVEEAQAPRAAAQAPRAAAQEARPLARGASMQMMAGSSIPGYPPQHTSIPPAERARGTTEAKADIAGATVFEAVNKHTRMFRRASLKDTSRNSLRGSQVDGSSALSSSALSVPRNSSVKSTSLDQAIDAIEEGGDSPHE